jgi:hypothetical protein
MWSGDFGSSTFFWAAYMASHRLACIYLRGVPDPNHNGRARINRQGHLQPTDLRQHGDLAGSRPEHGPGLRTVLVEPRGRLCEHSVSFVRARRRAGNKADASAMPVARIQSGFRFAGIRNRSGFLACDALSAANRFPLRRKAL